MPLFWRGSASAGWWWLVGAETYVAICFLAIATIYGLRTAGVSVDGMGVRSAPSVLLRVILLPYLALGALTLFLGRWFDSEGLLNLVAPGLYIGRLPFCAERARLRDAGIQAVLNLCWEFPRQSEIDQEPGLETAQVSILDGAAPTDEQFLTAVQIVAGWRTAGRCVLIHCASRSRANGDNHCRGPGSAWTGPGCRRSSLGCTLRTPFRLPFSGPEVGVDSVFEVSKP